MILESPSMIELRDVTVSFDGKIALSSLSLSIQKGERVAIIGPSGAGKSTLFNVLAYSETTYSGTYMLDGQPPSYYLHRKRRAKKIGLIRQHFDLVDSLPVIHNVLAGRLANWSLFKSLLSLIVPQEKQLALHALSRVGIEQKWAEKTNVLSGGEKQRVAIARMLVQNPELVLADEPVASLDPARALSILRILTNLVQEEQQTLIAILHSIDYAKEHFTRLIGLRDGQVQFDLPPDQITEQQLRALYELKETGE